MAEDLAVVLMSGSDLSPRYGRASKACAKQIAILIDGIACCCQPSACSPLAHGLTLDGREDDLIDELLLQVVNDHGFGTESQSLLLDGLTNLLAQNGHAAGSAIIF